MKARIFVDRQHTGLSLQLLEFLGGDVTVAHISYSIDRNYVHHALVLYTEGAERPASVAPAASGFIATALDPKA